MTHTPGPWKCKKVGSLADYDIRDEKNYPLAWVEHSQIHDTEANAHLIAAAPEMLRMLKEIHYVIEKEEMICPSCGVLCCSDDCELAEIIALAQAGGGSSAG